MNDAVDPALVAPSRHCLYIRGLPSRIKADEVRRFFIENEADCSIDFFSYTGSQAALNVALRFESHDVAKQIMRRYNETGLLGCRVSIVWFKDMIRARQRVRADPHLRARVQRAQEGRQMSGSGSPPPLIGWRFGQQNRSRSRSRSRQQRQSLDGSSNGGAVGVGGGGRRGSRSRSQSNSGQSRSASRSSSIRSAARGRGPRSPPEDEYEEQMSAAKSLEAGGLDHGAAEKTELRQRARSPLSPPPPSSPPLLQPSTSSANRDGDKNGDVGDGDDVDGNLRLVRAKKAELERAYRQDCDTFAVVAKVLVSKNPSLEAPVRDALREALRDIGQHCVEALREFARSLASNRQPGVPS